jgi:hypothetical protein
MGTVDYFYISLSLSVLVLAGCVLMLSLKIKEILENVRSVTEDAASVSTDILSIKDGLKTSIISLVQNLLEKAKKGGEKKS